MSERAEIGPIARVIGPRLEGVDVVVIETETLDAPLTLKISRHVAAELCRSINAALAAANRSELPEFLHGRLTTGGRPRGLRSLFRRRPKTLATEASNS